MKRSLQLKIVRSSRIIPSKGEFIELEIEFDTEKTVLDLLEEIRISYDKTLMYRHSCHHGSCGTCACIINGKERLACKTVIKSLDTEVITIEPLAGFPKIGDLVTSMESLYNAIPEGMSYRRPSELHPEISTPIEITRWERFEDCIECGSCMSACPVSNAFLGPAPLAFIHRSLQKGEGARTGVFIDLVQSPEGVAGCERHIECSRVCPSRVYPAKHIAELKREYPVSETNNQVF